MIGDDRHVLHRGKVSVVEPTGIIPIVHFNPISILGLDFIKLGPHAAVFQFTTFGVKKLPIVVVVTRDRWIDEWRRRMDRTGGVREEVRRSVEGKLQR